METTLVEHLAETLRVATSAVRIAVRPPLEHQTNTLYDVHVGHRHLIAKAFLNPAEWAEAPWREYEALQKVGPVGLGPHPIAYWPDLAQPTVVYEFIPGQAWDRHKPAPSELRQLAGAWLLLHALNPKGMWPSRSWGRTWRERSSWAKQQFAAYERWATTHFVPGVQAAHFCFEALERCQPNLTALDRAHALQHFCRADPRFANIITRREGGVAFVDWEDSGLGDPACEVADLLTHPNQEDLLSAKEWRVFLDPYFAALHPTDPSLADRVQHYVPLLCVFWLAQLLDQGLQHARDGEATQWLVNTLPSELRLQRYLARVRVWPSPDFAKQLTSLKGLAFFPK